MKIVYIERLSIYGDCLYIAIALRNAEKLRGDWALLLRPLEALRDRSLVRFRMRGAGAKGVSYNKYLDGVHPPELP